MGGLNTKQGGTNQARRDKLEFEKNFTGNPPPMSEEELATYARIDAESDGANSYKRSASPPATQETQNKKPLDLSEENKKLKKIEQFFLEQNRKESAPATTEEVEKFFQQKKSQKPMSSYEAIDVGLK